MNGSQKYAKIDLEGKLVYAPSILQPEAGGFIINPGEATLLAEGYLPVIETIPEHAVDDLLVISDIQIIGDEDSSDSTDSDSSDSSTIDKYILVTYEVIKKTSSSCFDIIVDGAKIMLTNCSYNIGGITFHEGDIDVTDILAQAEAGNVLAFAKDGNEVVQEGESGWKIELFTNLYSLRAFQNNAMNYAVPLYVMSGSNASFSIDLRNIPQMQMVEPIL